MIRINFIQHNIVHPHITPKLLFWGVVCGILLVVFSYGYFVQATIALIVEEKNVEYMSGELYSSIGVLESDYAKLRNRITKEYARTLGFTQARASAYAERKRLVGR